MKIGIVIPTYKREEKLKRCLASLAKQTHKDIVVYVYHDDLRKFAIGIWNEWLKAWPTQFPLVDAFCYLCDDVEVDQTCFEAVNKLMMNRWPDTDGVVGLHQKNIANMNGWCQSAMGVVGRKFADRFPDRKIFCPVYQRFHFDSELGQYARSVGRFEYCLEASLWHHHPVYETNEMDETHRLVRDPQLVAADTAMYKVRHENGLIWGKTFELGVNNA